jgi:hypothetical protein
VLVGGRYTVNKKAGMEEREKERKTSGSRNNLSDLEGIVVVSEDQDGVGTRLFPLSVRLKNFSLPPVRAIVGCFPWPIEGKPSRQLLVGFDIPTLVVLARDSSIYR